MTLEQQLLEATEKLDEASMLTAIEAGADVNAKRGDGFTALDIVCHRVSSDVIRIATRLRERGAKCGVAYRMVRVTA